MILAYTGLSFVSLVYGPFLSWLVLFVVVSVIYFIYKKARHSVISKREQSLIVNFIASPILVTIFFFLAVILLGIAFKSPDGSASLPIGVATFLIAGVLTFLVEKKLYDSMSKS